MQRGLLVWGLAIIIGALLALSASKMVGGGADLTVSTATTAEPLLAFELDRLFRSDRTPAEPGADPELRSQAAKSDPQRRPAFFQARRLVFWRQQRFVLVRLEQVRAA